MIQLGFFFIKNVYFEKFQASKNFFNVKGPYESLTYLIRKLLKLFSKEFDNFSESFQSFFSGFKFICLIEPKVGWPLFNNFFSSHILI